MDAIQFGHELLYGDHALLRRSLASWDIWIEEKQATHPKVLR